MESLDSLTVLYDTYQPACGPNTDIGGHLNGDSGEFVLGSNTLGMGFCTKKHSGKYCDQGSLIFNHTSPWLAAPAYSSGGVSKPEWTSTQVANMRRNTMCHEVGHMIGFAHNTGEGGCMASTLTGVSLQLSSHHVSHVNLSY